MLGPHHIIIRVQYDRQPNYGPIPRMDRTGAEERPAVMTETAPATHSPRERGKEPSTHPPSSDLREPGGYPWTALERLCPQQAAPGI